MSNSNNQTKAERKAQSKSDREKAEADKLRRLAGLEKVAVKQLTGKLMHSSASSTGQQKEKIVKLPQDSLKQGGSVKLYGTPYNGLNSQLLKFRPSETQAALMAWAHTVANPRTQHPHPMPLVVAPGASASVPLVYQCTLYGIASANAQGRVFIGANGDGWMPLSKASGGIDQIQPTNKYLTLPGVYATPASQGFPVHYTDGTYEGSSGGLAYPNASYAAGSPGLVVPGVNFVGLPPDLVTNVSANTRYNNISVELRCKPVVSSLNAAGELVAFNFRRAAVTENVPSTNSQTISDSLKMPTSYLSRHRVGVANWPADKWLSTVGVPNSGTCFGQWIPMGAESTGATSNAIVGYPAAFIMGQGLEPNSPVEFEATYNYAIYGSKTYITSSGGEERDSIQVDASRASPVIANGMTMVVPGMRTDGKHDPSGVAAVVKAEQQDSRMPSTKEVIEGVKTAADIFSGVTGTDIGAEIGEVIAGIGALLL